MAVIRQITTVASVAMPIEEKWTVRRCRYMPGEGAAGRVCIATGIHGDEMMGQLIAFGVVSRIMEQQEHLHGIVDVYPMLNPLGLDIGERLVPASTRLDMNRAFPGTPDGTPLESVCYQLVQDMRGADLVLDIHASTQNKSELYEVRLNAASAAQLAEQARALCPELIWIYPEKTAYEASLTGALCGLGTPAMILEADERRRKPQEIAGRVVEGIFCKLREMGLWTGSAVEPPRAQEEIPTIRTQEDVLRVTCEHPGVYVPEDCIGEWVQEGRILGRIIDALEGVVREEIKAPCAGLVFSQRSYSAVYPGTLIARLLRRRGEA